MSKEGFFSISEDDIKGLKDKVAVITGMFILILSTVQHLVACVMHSL
jgi:hypothetical protein